MGTIAFLLFVIYVLTGSIGIVEGIIKALGALAIFWVLFGGMLLGILVILSLLIMAI